MAKLHMVDQVIKQGIKPNTHAGIWAFQMAFFTIGVVSILVSSLMKLISFKSENDN